MCSLRLSSFELDIINQQRSEIIPEMRFDRLHGRGQGSSTVTRGLPHFTALAVCVCARERDVLRSFNSQAPRSHYYALYQLTGSTHAHTHTHSHESKNNVNLSLSRRPLSRDSELCAPGLRNRRRADPIALFSVLLFQLKPPRPGVERLRPSSQSFNHDFI